MRWFRLLHTTPTEAHGDIWGGVEGIPCAAQRPHRRLNGWVCQSFVGEGGKTFYHVGYLFSALLLDNFVLLLAVRAIAVWHAARRQRRGCGAKPRVTQGSDR